MSTVESVEHDLKSLGGGLEKSALAASARVLAGEMDDPENSATSKSMCAKELRETMATLRSLAPPKKENDVVDDLAAKRAGRRRSTGSAGAARKARS